MFAPQLPLSGFIHHHMLIFSLMLTLKNAYSAAGGDKDLFDVLSGNACVMLHFSSLVMQRNAGKAETCLLHIIIGLCDCISNYLTNSVLQ